jgi:hypothetical protein
MRVRPGEGAFALFTDQYELSMLQSYRAEGMDGGLSGRAAIYA